jgi:ribosomal protein S27AE
MSMTLDDTFRPAEGSPSAWPCAVFGHEMDNRTAAADGSHPRCGRCREPFLFEDGRLTHTRHVLGCFLRHHTYVRTGSRGGHNEYTCVRCGHPLLFAEEQDPYAAASRFHKTVRYLCGLFGHAVHAVTGFRAATESLDLQWSSSLSSTFFLVDNNGRPQYLLDHNSGVRELMA